MARTPKNGNGEDRELLASPDDTGTLQPVHLVQGDAAGGEVVEAEIMADSDRPATAVAVRPDAAAEVEGYVAASHPAMIRLNNWLEEMGSVGNDADMVVANIIAQVLAADSVDEVLADTSATGMRELLGVPLIIHTVKPLRSSYETLAPWFFYCDAQRLDTLEHVGVTTGAQTVIAQLVRVDMLDGFPLECMPVKATKKPTANGYWPYKLTFRKTIAAE